MDFPSEIPQKPSPNYMGLQLIFFISGMTGFDPSENHKNIAVWWKKVREHFNPIYDEGHVIINKIIKKNQKVASKI